MTTKGTKKICMTCENDGNEKCAKCIWYPNTKYPTKYEGPKFRSTKGMDNTVINRDGV